MDAEQPKRLSAGKRALGFAALLLSIVVGTSIGFLLVRAVFGGGGDGAGGEEMDQGGTLLLSVIMGLFGTLSLGAGVLGYVIAVATRCFTSDWRKPFWKGLRARLYVANIVVPLLLIIAIASYVCMVMMPLLGLAGLPTAAAFLVPFFATVIVCQLISVSVNIWVAVVRGATKMRLLALGVPEQALTSGVYVGVSDPSRSGAKRLFVEDDLGMLWLGRDEMAYRGDTQEFRVPRGRLVAVERAANVWSWAAYWGAVDVIIRFTQEDGVERRVRLHPMGNWTIRGVAKTSDWLADAVGKWQQGGGGEGQVRSEK